VSTFLSTTVPIRPSLEQLEARDLLSTLGAVLPFFTDRVIVEKSLKNSEAWTSNYQNDFNALQSDIIHLGPHHPTTLADLAQTMADYGFAQQTFNLVNNTTELFRAGIAFGISNGFFDESDVGAIFFSLRDIQKLESITHSQADKVHDLVVTLSAFRPFIVAMPSLRAFRPLVGWEQRVGEYIGHRPRLFG
jgi:hypothetical protein